VLVTTKKSATYRYVGEVNCDWFDFEDLVRRARFAGDDERFELLLAAMSLIRGQPFGADPRYDAVGDEVTGAIRGALRRVALEVSKGLLKRERYEEAFEAASLGIVVDPDDVELHRQRLECCKGDESAIDDAWADTVRRLKKDAQQLRSLRDNLKGMARFVRKEQIAGS